jgi:hypothetical protein
MMKFIKDTAPMIVGEGIVMLAVILGAVVLDLIDVIKFDARIVAGAILGAAISCLNYIFLTVSVDKAINDYMALRGNKEMSDEEAEAFAKKNSAPVQNAIKTSLMLRTFSMMAALIFAFITKWFNPVAMIIPLFAFRPLLTVVDFVQKKKDKTPDPSKFIKYSYDDEEKEEKESDQ